MPGMNIRALCDDASSEILTGVSYATTAFIRKQLVLDVSFLRKIDYFILDEIHERSIENDIICLLLRDYLIRSCDESQTPKIIFMSATPNFGMYVKYFQDFIQSGDDMPYEIIGRSYPIDEIYLHDFLPSSDGSGPKAPNTFTKNDGGIEDVLALVNSFDRRFSIKRFILKWIHEKQISLAAKLVTALGNRPHNPVNSFLIFVDGRDDIFYLRQKLEKKA